MQKMIGKGTGTGKVTSLGSAKSDDPVFKEGWSVTTQPQSVQTSPEPPSNSTDEDDDPDDSECELRDEDSGEGIRCPCCDSGQDCPHRLALIDRTFCDFSSGYCANRYDLSGDLVEAAFLEKLKGGATREYSWDDEDLDALWQYAFDNYSAGADYVEIDGDVLMRLEIGLFEQAGGEEYPGLIEQDGEGPDCSSALTLLFAENPAKVVEAAESELRKRLNLAAKAAL